DGAGLAIAWRTEHFTVPGSPCPRIWALLRRGHEARPLAPQDADGHDPDLPEHGVGGEGDAGRAHAGSVYGCIRNPQVVLAVVSARNQFCFPAAGIPRR